MGTFERFLSVWVFLAILLGVGLGLLVPEAFEQLARLEFAHVNLVVGLLIWLMIYPMMVQIDWSSVRQVGRQPAGLGLTLVVNWVIKPFTMAALAIFFFKWVFADLVSADQADQYIAGMILLGVAPCTAMVFVWSQLVKGDAAYTLVQVSVNDLIMVVAFAPIAAFLLGVTNLTVPWETLLVSVVFYVVLPLLAGVYTRSRLASNPQALTALMARLKPLSMLGLVATVAILFGFQAETMLANPLPMVLIAIPLILQSYGVFAVAWIMAKRLRLSHAVAGPACLIGTSNFFELAVAVAISLFGLNSGAALATVVGVLVEVPVMLSLVHWVNHRRQATETA